MLFHSKDFIFIFFPIFFLLYYFAIRKNQKIGVYLLILSSLIFYSYYKFSYIFLILISVILNFFFFQNIKKNKIIIFFAIFLNIALLVYYKYTNFLIYNLNTVFKSNIDYFNIVLPLAISFLTFQQISLLVDRYAGKVENINFTSYLGYSVFFPHLIAGPILTSKEVLPQISNKKKIILNYDNILCGLNVFIIGLFKKIFIADNLAFYSDSVFNSISAGNDLSMLTAFIGCLSFSFQIYFDFSAYSDMAVGLAKIMGFDLPINFNSPYKSASFIEFWSRWHITLSRFIKNYIFQPLSLFINTNLNVNFYKKKDIYNLGIVKEKVLTIFAPVFLAFLISGLWHGAAWGFVMWGGMHGFFVSINYLFRSFNFRLPDNFFIKKIFVLIVFFITCILWVPFRSADLEATILFYKFLFLSNNFINLSDIDNFYNIKLLILLILSYFIIFFLPNSYEITKYSFFQKNYSSNINYLNFYFKKNFYFLLIFLILFILSIINLEQLNYEQFIYFQF